MVSKSISASCGHIKRRLSQDEPLKGKTLKFALEILGNEFDDSKAGMELKTIRDKLIKGQPLTEYEYHYFVEVILLRVRLEGEI